eukprot:jgi/Chrzof1/15112/Cz09g27210.t1
MVCSIIKDVIEGPEFDLVEAAAAAVCRELLKHDNRIEAVQVHLQKPHVAFPGPVESVGGYDASGNVFWCLQDLQRNVSIYTSQRQR